MTRVRTSIGQGALAGYFVGAAGATAVWIAVTVLTATAGRDEAGFAVVGALALGPAILLLCTALGTVLGAIATILSPSLRRDGPLRAAALVVFGLVAFCCWGYLADVLPGRWLVFVPGPGPELYNTTVFVVTAVGAVVGATASVLALVRPIGFPTRRNIALVGLCVVVGAAAGLLGWWIRRGFPSWASGLPSSGYFVGAGFTSDVDLDQDWVWGVTIGAVLALLVATAALLARRATLVVPLAAVAAGTAAYVSATTGVMFPVIDLSDVLQFPQSGSYAAATEVLSPGAIAVTVVVWAAAAALSGWAAVGIARRGGGAVTTS